MKGIVHIHLYQEFALIWNASSVFINSGICIGMNDIVRIQLSQVFAPIGMALFLFIQRKSLLWSESFCLYDINDIVRIQ